MKIAVGSNRSRNFAMERKIGLLRGINVGGKRKILMNDLKALCEKIGLENITTYIQSGNLIFSSNQPNSDIENKLEKAITQHYGFDVPVIVRTEKELLYAINNNPFLDKNVDIKQLHLTFLKENPQKENIDKTCTFNYAPEKFKIDDKNVFIFCAGKYRQSKLTNNFFEKQLKVKATTRNWKTIMKIEELIKN